MLDVLSFVTAQIIPTLIVDILKYLRKKKIRDVRDSRFS